MFDGRAFYRPWHMLGHYNIGLRELVCWPLLIIVVELRQCMGSYVTLSKQDILEDLGSAIYMKPKAGTQRVHRWTPSPHLP